LYNLRYEIKANELFFRITEGENMVTLTPTAVKAVREFIDQTPATAEADKIVGLRVQATAGG
jgi:hypothetical protein